MCVCLGRRVGISQRGKGRGEKKEEPLTSSMTLNSTVFSPAKEGMASAQKPQARAEAAWESPSLGRTPWVRNHFATPS